MERSAIQEAARQSKEPETDVHSDFSLGQLLLMDKGQIGVIDFDLASLGDPALDVGNFHPAARSARVLTGEVR